MTRALGKSTPPGRCRSFTPRFPAVAEGRGRGQGDSTKIPTRLHHNSATMLHPDLQRHWLGRLSPPTLHPRLVFSPTPWQPFHWASTTKCNRHLPVVVGCRSNDKHEASLMVGLFPELFARCDLNRRFKREHGLYKVEIDKAGPFRLRYHQIAFLLRCVGKEMESSTGGVFCEA